MAWWQKVNRHWGAWHYGGSTDWMDFISSWTILWFIMDYKEVCPISGKSWITYRFRTNEAMSDLTDHNMDDEIVIIDVPVTKTPISLVPSQPLPKVMNPCCGIQLVFPPSQNEHILLWLGQSSNNEDLSQSFVLLSNPNPKAAFVQGWGRRDRRSWIAKFC